MKKAIIILMFVVLLGGFAYYTLFLTLSDEPITQTKDNQENIALKESDLKEQKNELIEGNGSLESLRLLNKDLECVISYVKSDETSTIEGTYFVSEGNLRADFLTESPDLAGQVLSSMIINENMMYVWSEIEGELYGMKKDLSLKLDSSSDMGEPVSLDQGVKYNCKAWENVDRTVFVPPSNVLFRDMGEIIKTGMEYGTVYKEEVEE
jgi:hypothetical protein